MVPYLKCHNSFFKHSEDLNMPKLNLLLLASLLFMFQQVGAQEVQSLQDHISVVGSGEITEEPDQAILNISISAQEPNLVEAKQVADQRYTQVLEQIKSAGIEERQIKSTRINAQPQYEWGSSKRIYKGERVSRSLRVTINDLDKVSELMQSIVESGVSTIDSMTTGFQDPQEMQQQALGLAADDAKAKAEFLAQRLGRKLGQAYLITEHNYTSPVNQPNMQMMRSSAAIQSEQAPEEMFGTQVIKATVNVSFNLL